MRKVALCLFGKFNNRLSEKSGREGFEYINEKILKGRDVDIFIHSWDTEHQEEIEALYGSQIKEAIFQDQIDFKPIIEEEKIDESIFNPPGKQSFRTIANSFSFFYSRGKSIELKKNFEEKTGDKYDIVISSRFDLGQMDKYNGYQAYRTSEIYFDESLDMSFIYSANWDQLNAGYADMWFYSSSENMDQLSLMFERSKDYFKKDSQYIKTLTSGWPDSNSEDEFSNEFDHQKAAESLKKYHISDAHNNHIMHKWFFIDTGLYEKSKFLSTTTKKVCVAMYSHSDYSDVWPLYFGQNQKHCKFIGPKFLFVNKKMENVPEDYEQIIYDETQSYPEKVSYCLKQLKQKGFDVCLFEHEDMILYKDIDFLQIKQAVDQVLKSSSGNVFKKGFDCIRLIKASKSFSIPYLKNKNIHWMLPFSSWLYSVQPTIWKIDSLLNMLERHTGDSIWELEVNAQKTCRKLKLKCGYLHSNGEKAGLHHWDNSLYPYVATAIVKGKWNISEYEAIMPNLLKQYGIDIEARGTF